MQSKISDRKAAEIINSRNIKSRQINQNQDKILHDQLFGIMKMNQIY